MSQPKNHHWLPRFLMSPWECEDGIVKSFFRPHSYVVFRRKGTKSLGSEIDLYMLERSQNKYWMETKLFTETVDTPASLIRDKILSGGMARLTPEEKEKFSLFLNFLTIREASVVNEQKKRPKIPFAIIYWRKCDAGRNTTKT